MDFEIIDLSYAASKNDVFASVRIAIAGATFKLNVEQAFGTLAAYSVASFELDPALKAHIIDAVYARIAADAA